MEHDYFFSHGLIINSGTPQVLKLQIKSKPLLYTYGPVDATFMSLWPVGLN